MNSVVPSSRNTGPRPRDTKTSGTWTQQSLSRSILSAEGFPAKTLARLGRDVGLQVQRRVFGASFIESFAEYDRGTWWQKTSQRSFGEECQTYLGKWPRSGMMRGGIVCELPMLVRRTAERDGLWYSGEKWPTTTVSGNYSPKSGTGLRTEIGGKLNPEWALLLMGFPQDWMDVGPPGDTKPPTRGSRKGKRKRAKVVEIDSARSETR